MIVTYPIHTQSYAHAIDLAQRMAESHGYKTARVLGVTKVGEGSWEIKLMVM